MRAVAAVAPSSLAPLFPIEHAGGVLDREEF
jgi:hypothetical protein